MTGDGVQADPSKISARMDWPIPQNVRDLRGFLGLREEATYAFQKHQEAMIQAHVLALCDFLRRFTIKTDASGQVQKWRPYLLGHQFTVITYQKSLKFMLEHRHMVGEHQRWVSKLLGYDFKILYRPKKENGAADALLRRREELEFAMLSVSLAGLSDLKNDPEVVALRRLWKTRKRVE
nr:hypothetical protein [Tanacetum cinerariifolium]